MLKELVIANVQTCKRCIRDAGGTCGAPCPCPIDGTSAIDHAVAGRCPAKKFAGETGAPGKPEDWGPRLWAEMHRKADADQAYVDSVTRRLPCGECKNWWGGWLMLHPPQFNDWFRWAWECHNAVNEKLGKPGMTFDEARLRWPTP